MDGDALIYRARTILKDHETDVDKGNYWTDREIVMTLNVAQDIFINYSIENKHEHNLIGLLTNTGFISPPLSPAVYHSLSVIAPDYLHYYSGVISEDERLARIYIGGSAENYLYVGHDAIAIVGDAVYFIDHKAPLSGVTYDYKYRGGGTLYYYKRPSYIGATALGDNPLSPIPGITPRADFSERNFAEYIYSDVICNYATVLLTMKEIQNQRAIKKQGRGLMDLAMQPPEFSHYISNQDIPDKMMRKSADDTAG